MCIPPSTSVSGHRHRILNALRRPVLAVLISLFFSAAACDDGIPGSRARDSIPPETFVEAMVELRQEALASPSGQLAPGDADQILERHDLTADDMRHFADTHGRNVPMMTVVWDEVARRVQEANAPDDPEPDSEAETEEP